MVVAKSVLYCGVCGVPPEYCSFVVSKSKLGQCQKWLQQNHPDHYNRIYGDASGSASTASGAQQSDITSQLAQTSIADAKAAPAPVPAAAAPVQVPKQKREKAIPKVVIKTASRGGRKQVTHIQNLTSNLSSASAAAAASSAAAIDLKKIAKKMANKFACGASVVANPAAPTLGDEIVIQGDVAMGVKEFLAKEFNLVDVDVQLDTGKKKKGGANAAGGNTGEDED